MANATKMDWAFNQASTWWKKRIGSPCYEKIFELAGMLRRAARRNEPRLVRRRTDPRDPVVQAAVKFAECELAQTSLEELKGTNSLSAPAEFLHLMEQVTHYKNLRRRRK